MKKYAFLLVCLIMLGFPGVDGQDNRTAFSTSGWWKPAGPKFSPVVNADRTITFRLKAPDAQKVSLLFDEWDVVDRPMKKDHGGYLEHYALGRLNPVCTSIPFWLTA